MKDLVKGLMAESSQRARCRPSSGIAFRVPRAASVVRPPPTPVVLIDGIGEFAMIICFGHRGEREL